jgi:GNAT superfamily N-acetyltransferase
MRGALTVRRATAGDGAAWLTLWRGYCEALQGEVADDVSDAVWRRIISADPAVGCLLAAISSGEIVGFANYILHPHTWSLRSVCYLEDLFVTPEARGIGAGRAFINGLVSLGRECGCRRVYWHTHADNHQARRLYDRIASSTDYVRYDIEL